MWDACASKPKLSNKAGNLSCSLEGAHVQGSAHPSARKIVPVSHSKHGKMADIDANAPMNSVAADGGIAFLGAQLH